MNTLAKYLLLVALGTAATLSAAPSGVTLEIQPTRQIFPRDAQNRGLTEGWARVAVAIDADGRLLEHLVIAASDRAFAKEADQLVRTARISPPREDGRPLALRTEVNIAFRNNGLFIVDDFQAIAELYLHGRLDRAEPVRMASPRELDHLPQAIEAPMPPYATELASRGVTGRVVVDFYIDEAGRVRLPAIASADHPELADLALNALAQWRFAPPTRYGQPVLTHVRQPFDFTLKLPLNATLTPVPNPPSS